MESQRIDRSSLRRRPRYPYNRCRGDHRDDRGGDPASSPDGEWRPTPAIRTSPHAGDLVGDVVADSDPTRDVGAGERHVAAVFAGGFVAAVADRLQDVRPVEGRRTDGPEGRVEDPVVVLEPDAEVVQGNRLQSHHSHLVSYRKKTSAAAMRNSSMDFVSELAPSACPPLECGFDEVPVSCLQPRTTHCIQETTEISARRTTYCYRKPNSFLASVPRGTCDRATDSRGVSVAVFVGFNIGGHRPALPSVRRSAAGSSGRSLPERCSLCSRSWGRGRSVGTLSRR